MIDQATGEITLDSGLRIPPRWTEDVFLSSSLASGAVPLVTNGEWHSFRARPALISAVLFGIDLTFRAGVLDSVSLELIREDDATSWDDWSEQQELQRKSDHDAWLTRIFGSPPPHSFPWGEVTSLYYPQDGSSSITVSYV